MSNLQAITIEQFENSYMKILGHFASSMFHDELALARKEFFENTGTLDENKQNYTLRMHQFYDWYFLTRPLKGYMQTPLSVCDTQRELRLTEEDLQTVEILRQAEHSLYELVKVKKNEITLKNLFKDKKSVVISDQHIFEFDEKEFFEARIVTIGNQKHFLKGFCFHPESAQKFILSEVKVYQKNPDLNPADFMLRLNKMRYKFEQYRHMKPELIYTNENKLGL
ncbi:MAG: hypothetical protein ACK41T_12880 [Pseudobdellovibrio sp.]